MESSKSVKTSLLALWAGLLMVSVSVRSAGSWRVTPIRVELDARARSATVTVINEGDEPLHLQVKAFEWTQDEKGDDQYHETDDLIFFPKLLEVRPNDARILRVGLKAPAVARERTYRLFLEEIPASREPREERSAEVTITLRFGLPIFVKPVKEEPKGTLEGVTLSNGQLNVVVRNVGNTHFFIESISVRGRDANGREVYTQDLNGWYLLGGATRTYTVKVPADVCPKLNRLDVGVKTDRFEMKGGLDVRAGMCTGPAALASAPEPARPPAPSKPPSTPPASLPAPPSLPPDIPAPPAGAGPSIQAPPVSAGLSLPGPVTQDIPAPPAGGAPVLALIQGRRFDEAVRVSLEHLRQWSGPGWLLQVEIACQPQTIVEDASRLRPPERIYLFPRTVGGRSCYALAYGIFRSVSEARQALKAVEAAALDLASAPVLVSVADVLRRAR
jgi:fimbrial chaperone protein